MIENLEMVKNKHIVFIVSTHLSKKYTSIEKKNQLMEEVIESKVEK